MKKFLLIFLTTTYFCLAAPLQAQSPTQVLGESIGDLRENLQQKVREKLAEITDTTPLNPKKAYPGTIVELNEDKIKIKTQTQEMEFTLASDTAYLNQKQRKIKREDLKKDQNVLLLSLNQDTINYAKRILLVESKDLENNKKTTLGTIADISTAGSVITLVSVNNQNEKLQIKLDSKTEIRSKDNKVLKVSDLKKDQKIICISGPLDKQSYPALRLITL